MKKQIYLFVIFLLFIGKVAAQDLSEVYQNVNPAVVVIYATSKDVVTNSDYTTKKVTQNGLGSGFMISDQLLVTAAHVITANESLNVVFNDGESIPGKVLSSYSTADIALVKLFRPKINATIVPLGDSDNLKIGEQIFIVGAPFGLNASLSSGYVSGLRRESLGKNPFTTTEFIQTDASINQGNSGGPMFNLKGEVVGVVSHITTKSGGFDGIGYASSSNLVSKLLINNNMPWLGADLHSLDDIESKILNLPQANGLLVQRVSSTSIFGRMGVKGGDTKAILGAKELLLGGDIILKFNDIKFELNDETLTKLASFANGLSENPSFKISVLRAGRIITLENK